MDESLTEQASRPGVCCSGVDLLRIELSLLGEVPFITCGGLAWYLPMCPYRNLACSLHFRSLLQVGYYTMSNVSQSALLRLQRIVTNLVERTGFEPAGVASRLHHLVQGPLFGSRPLLENPCSPSLPRCRNQPGGVPLTAPTYADHQAACRTCHSTASCPSKRSLRSTCR